MIPFYYGSAFFNFPKVTSSNDDVHFFAPLTEKLPKCFTDSYRIEIPVKLTVFSKFEAGDK